MRALRARRRQEKLAAVDALVAERAAEAPVQEALPGITPRGPGRPPGASEIDPELWRRWMLGRYGSPLSVWGEAYGTPIEMLARRLQCTLLEAARFRVDCARLAAPFLHREQPRAIDVTASAGTVLVAIAPSLAAAWQAEDERASGGLAVERPPVEVEAEEEGRSPEVAHSLPKGDGAR